MNSYISMLKKIEHSDKKSLPKLDMNHGISFNCIRKETILLFYYLSLFSHWKHKSVKISILTPSPIIFLNYVYQVLIKERLRMLLLFYEIRSFPFEHPKVEVFCVKVLLKQIIWHE